MSPLVRFIIFSTVFVKGGSFLSLPFLTVYLQKHFGASPAVTGFIVGLNPTAGLIMGFAGGYLSDLLGRKRILMTSMLLCTLSYFSFALATKLWHFTLGSFVLGAATGALYSTLRALISDLTAPQLRPKAFRLQYLAVNVGASVGPLVGAVLLLSNFSLGFAITGILFFLYFITFVLFDRFTHNPVFEEVRIKTSFIESIKILQKDTGFSLLIVGSTLLALCYSQIDTLLPQHLRTIAGDSGIKTYSWLLAANSITVILGLYPSIWAAEKLGLMGSVIWGQIFMGIGFAAMAFVGSSALLLILCMIFLTIGEVFAFSNWSVVIDSFAKPGMKGSYFGASGFHMLGNSVGPVVGGFLYQTSGPYIAFCTLGMSAIIGVFFYKLAENRRTPQHKKALTH